MSYSYQRVLHNALSGYCRRKLCESPQHQHVQLGTTAGQIGSSQVSSGTHAS